MNFIHLLDDPWADHPVVNRHICNGGGGSSAPTPPDYSQFITATSGVANDLTAKGRELYGWGTDSAKKLYDLASTVGNRAGAVADWATQGAKDTYSNWLSTYGPLYQAQAKNAQNFVQNLPATMESWAGKWGADAASAIDAGKASLLRKMQGDGLTRPGVAQNALDEIQANQRALAVTSQSEAGRMAARQYGDQLTSNALQAGQIFPTVSQGLSGTALQAGQQQIAAPSQAISTGASAYAPALQAYSTAAPYLNNWQSSMSGAYNQQLQAFNANQQASSNSPLTTILPLAAGIAGSIVAPGLGTMAAGALGSMAPSLMGAGASFLGTAAGGRRYAVGGDVGALSTGVPMAGQAVPPAMSPSGGAQTDDVHAVVDGDPRNVAAINTGEFIWPKDVVAWRGEQWMQKEILKARTEREQQTVAAPQAGPPPPGAMNTKPPMMGSTPV